MEWQNHSPPARFSITPTSNIMRLLGHSIFFYNIYGTTCFDGSLACYGSLDSPSINCSIVTSKNAKLSRLQENDLGVCIASTQPYKDLTGILTPSLTVLTTSSKKDCISAPCEIRTHDSTYQIAFANHTTGIAAGCELVVQLLVFARSGADTRRRLTCARVCETVSV